MEYAWHLTFYFSMYSLLALGLNLLVGHCGPIAITPAAYFALGAYTCALVQSKFKTDFVLVTGLSMLVAAASSLMSSLPAKRLRGDMFIILSLAAQGVIVSVLYNWTDLTNGPFGLTNLAPLRILGNDIYSVKGIGLLSLATAGVAAVLMRYWMASPWGRLLKAVRDEPTVVASLGKDPGAPERAAFAVASAWAAAAGVLYAGYVRFVEPSIGTLDHSILILSMVLVGGPGTFRGALVGPLILVGLVESLRWLQLPGPLAANIRLLLYGLLLVVMIHLRPQGVAGEHRIE